LFIINLDPLSRQQRDHHHPYYHHHIAMTLTQSDLRNDSYFYFSSRNLGDLLIGEEDAAQPLMEASSSGNNSALQTLLSEPQWSKIILDKQHVIYAETDSKADPTDAREVRQVFAMPMSNFERAFEAAALKGHADAVSTLLAFAKQNGIDDASLTRRLAGKIIGCGHYPVIIAIATADPDFVNSDIGHGWLPLYEAARLGKTAIVAVLLDYGADPLRLPTKPIYKFKSTLMSYAAKAPGPQMTELLLKRGVPIAGTGALHSAAFVGELDTMRLLIQHGDAAGLNETLSNYEDWTPMHFAALRGRVDAMQLLEQSGARSDLTDGTGRTAAELLEFTQAGGRII
jgi:ankyrin repeat protein